MKIIRLMYLAAVLFLTATHAIAQLSAIDKLNAEAVKLYHSGQPKAATDLLNQALLEIEKSVPKNSADEFRTLENLSIMHWSLDQYDLAKPALKRLLVVAENRFGAENIYLAGKLDLLWDIHFKQGDFPLAEPLAKRSLEITEKYSQAPQRDLLRRTDSLAGIYFQRGKYDLALLLFERVLKAREASLPKDHLDIAGSLNNLGMVYFQQSLYLKSVDFFQRALDIRQKSPKADPKEIAESLRNIAAIHKKLGEYTLASEKYRSALSIAEKANGDDDLGTIFILNGLADLLVDQDRYLEAYFYVSRAMAATEKTFGIRHPEYIRSLNLEGIILTAKGGYDDAKKVLDKALVIATDVDPSDPSIDGILGNLADLYREQGNYALAESTYQGVLKNSEKYLSKEKLESSATMHNLGLLYMLQNKFELAEPLFDAALTSLEKSVGPNHPEVAKTLKEKAKLYKKTNREKQAQALTDRAEKILAIKR